MTADPKNETLSSKQTKKLEHIAFIMDGNGRWATRRGMPREYGHTVGAKIFRQIVEYCFRIGIGTVTVYAFSAENWRRPPKEVNTILSLFSSYLKMGVDEMMEDNIRIRFLGDRTPFAEPQKKLMDEIERDSAGNKFCLNIAVNYGGRQEIAYAFNKIHEKITKGLLNGNIDEKIISDELYTAGQNDPDLVVRTGGEMRLSNFLTWQSNYSELYFTDVLWPDMTEADVDKAVNDYYGRKRRFGGV